jgi:hypothetical protein
VAVAQPQGDLSRNDDPGIVPERLNYRRETGRHRVGRSTRLLGQLAPITLRTVRHDITERSQAPDRTDSTLANEPMENAEQNEPTLPIDSADPTDPIDRTEPRDPMHSTESVDLIDKIEPPRLFMRSIIAGPPPC